MRIVGEVDPGVAARLAAASKLATLEDVLWFGLPRGWDVLEVIVQDEYTHDVVVRADAFLVFDTT